MDQAQEEVSQSAQIPENQGILINDMKYSYSITKSESSEGSLLIKLFEPNEKSNMYFIYEAPMEQLTKEVNFLAVYETLDEIIDNLKDIFSQGNARVEEKDGVYNLEFKVSGIKNKFSIQLTKHEIEQPKEAKSGLENKVKEIVISKEDKINYIILQVKIDEEDLNKEIRLLNHVKTNENDYNFGKDDIETIIDNQIVDIMFENDKYYWNFSTTGTHTIKIIFKKKLLRCNYLFSYDDVDKIDCSNFDCSQIIDCSYMFYNCFSLIEINLGKLDFALSNDFSFMFAECHNLEKLDVSYFNANNSKSFHCMFRDCSKLKEINVSKFKTTNCENIFGMFARCSSLESIDMQNWDMKNINNIDYLFMGCSKLKNIKMNFNNDKKLEFYQTFKGLPEGGSFVWKKGTNCNEFLKHLPASWNRTQE